jgi:hypothetical protein
MSGILDSKSRVLDTVLTFEGRRQLALGGIDVAYVSFSDSAAFYKADIASGSADATTRLYLEACQLPQDVITFQADDSGNLMPFPNGSGIQLAGGSILEYSYQAPSGSFIGASQTVNNLTGSSFAASASVLLGSSLENFQRLYVLASHDDVFEDDGFALGPDDVTFAINSSRPVSDPAQYAVSVNALDSIFSDPRFSHLPNFRYLPPLNPVSDASVDLSDHRATSKYQLANYPPWGRSQVGGLSYKQLASELQYYDKLGYSRTITFDPTSLDNNLVGQMFEQQGASLKKLDVVEYGRMRTGDPGAPVAHVFFAGKVYVDSNGTDTFVHLFTLVFT